MQNDFADPAGSLYVRGAGGRQFAEPERMSRLTNGLEPNNLRLLFSGYNFAKDVAVDLAEDLSFARSLVRALGPAARASSVTLRGPIFPALRPFSVPALAGKRIGLVTSGGSGATASLCGIKRAFEEAGLEVSAISACSGSILFASLWACGIEAEEIARFWLSLPARDYIDPDWRALARAPLRLFKSYAGLLRGEALERSYERYLGRRTLAHTRIPLHTVVWNIDQNRVEYLSSRSTPELTIAQAVRVSISIPIMVEPVRINGHMYADGGIVDVFPTPPLRSEAPFDVIFGVNCYLPENFEGEDIGNWYDMRFAVLRASGQLRYATYLQLAREHAHELAGKLWLLHPVPHAEVRGAKFYESFWDRSSWPRFMALGYACARAALERFSEPRSSERKRDDGASALAPGA